MSDDLGSEEQVLDELVYFKQCPRGRFLDKMTVLGGVLSDAIVTLS